MLKKYVKKPVVIEAIQITEDTEMRMVTDLFDPDNTYISVDSDGIRIKIRINTLEGTMQCSWGDYLIRGVAGELYPCKPDIFAQTYEEVDE